MGLVLVSYSITDADGDVSSMPIYIPDAGLAHADVAGFADNFAVLVDNVTDGFISAINITYQHTVPVTVNSAAVANSEVQKGALFQFSATGTPYKHSVRVPAFTPGKFSGDSVNTADADVIVFVNALAAGLTPVATLVKPSNKYEMDLASNISAVKSFRK